MSDVYTSPSLYFSFQVFISNIDTSVSVYLDKKRVHQETLVPDKSLLSIGTCSFRFDYKEGILSPLREDNSPIKASKVAQ